MFHPIRPAIRARMQALEAIDARDRRDGTPRRERLRQIPPETGQFLALMLANAPAGALLEIRMSAGYSTFWLALAAEAQQREIITFEVLPEKAALARETFRLAEVKGVVRLVEGDVLDYIAKCEQIGFCFLDAEKEVYAACYVAVVPRLVPGGLLVADNAINHLETLQAVI